MDYMPKSKETLANFECEKFMRHVQLYELEYIYN